MKERNKSEFKIILENHLKDNEYARNLYDYWFNPETAQSKNLYLMKSILKNSSNESLEGVLAEYKTNELTENEIKSLKEYSISLKNFFILYPLNKSDTDFVAKMNLGSSYKIHSINEKGYIFSVGYVGPPIENKIAIKVRFK